MGDVQPREIYYGHSLAGYTGEIGHTRTEKAARGQTKREWLELVHTAASVCCHLLRRTSARFDSFEVQELPHRKPYSQPSWSVSAPTTTAQSEDFHFRFAGAGMDTECGTTHMCTLGKACPSAVTAAVCRDINCYAMQANCALWTSAHASPDARDHGEFANGPESFAGLKLERGVDRLWFSNTSTSSSESIARLGLGDIILDSPLAVPCDAACSS